MHRNVHVIPAGCCRGDAGVNARRERFLVHAYVYSLNELSPTRRAHALFAVSVILLLSRRLARLTAVVFPLVIQGAAYAGPPAAGTVLKELEQRPTISYVKRDLLGRLAPQRVSCGRAAILTGCHHRAGFPRPHAPALVTLQPLDNVTVAQCSQPPRGGCRSHPCGAILHQAVLILSLDLSMSIFHSFWRFGGKVFSRGKNIFFPVTDSKISFSFNGEN